jgi:hypothetical protein
MVHDQEVVGSNLGTVYWIDVSDDGYTLKKIMRYKYFKNTNGLKEFEMCVKCEMCMMINIPK